MNNMFQKTLENLRISITTLLSSKVRAFLTMVGITIGVMSVVLLLSLGQAFQDYIVGEFSSFGSNLVAIWGKTSNTIDIQPGGPDNDDAEQLVTFFEPLSWDDYVALNDPFRVPAARVVSPIANIAVPVRWGETEVVIATAGVTETYTDAVSLDIVGGRFISPQEVQENARVVVFNLKATSQIFGEGAYPVGQTVKLNGLSFEVIGVLDAGADESSASIIIPFTTLYQRLSSERLPDGSLPVAAVMMQAIDEDSSEALVEQIRTVLREEHDLRPDEDDDFQIFAQTAFLDSLSTITGLVTAFLAVIAGISLVVGGIGIMNIMLVTVTERTREIGLRKAVGAQNIDILMQFITEAIMLSVLGGLLGTILAYLLSAAMSSAVPDLNVIIRPSSVMLATIVSVIIGVFFGAFPANRAAKMNPIDALRFAHLVRGRSPCMIGRDV